ncbi:hypothetical protein LTR95_006260 [Oleoguttula sp. CCFEE 5521]
MKTIIPTFPDPTYPRPDFSRPARSWRPLNGEWSFSFDDLDHGLASKWHINGIEGYVRKIKVPFVYQSRASGIDDQDVHEVLWYERTIVDIRDDDERRDGQRLLLRFGAVDYEATVWLNGRFVGEHRGGNTPFDFDITDAMEAEARIRDPLGGERDCKLIVRVFDSAMDTMQPRGKQHLGSKPEGIWYTQSSGIWQSVWLESVPRIRIADSSHGTIIRSDDIEGGQLHCDIAVDGRLAGQWYSLKIDIVFGNFLLSSTDGIPVPANQRASCKIDVRILPDVLKNLSPDDGQSYLFDDPTAWLEGVALWSPEHPQLYHLGITLFDSTGHQLDEIHMSTGMRAISWHNGDGTLRLNGRPYFQALVLDQGYWPETLMTPPTAKALEADIKMAKAMGFNGCRKHQKVEDAMFMYHADRLGFLVWGEMASCQEFSHDSVERFDQEWKEMVRRDINHPCIVAWTLANESWGYPDLHHEVAQRTHLKSLYYQTRLLDPTRPINSNCGWEHVVTDLTTFHDYADAGGMSERCASEISICTRGRAVFLPPTGTMEPATSHTPGAPILCTEFGGINMVTTQDASKEGWGYTTATDPADLLHRLAELCKAVVASGLVSGFCYTQLTDIESETNGLYTYDRKPKLEPEEVKVVIQRARDTYYHSLPPEIAKTTIKWRGRLRETCYAFQLLQNGRILRAMCATTSLYKTQNPEYVPSELNLNDCLTNAGGQLRWAKGGGGFADSCRNIMLAGEGLAVYLLAEAGDGVGGWVKNKANLGDVIGNEEGRLVFRD